MAWVTKGDVAVGFAVIAIALGAAGTVGNRVISDNAHRETCVEVNHVRDSTVRLWELLLGQVEPDAPRETKQLVKKFTAEIQALESSRCV